MNKLKFVDELLVMLHTGELPPTEETPREVEKILEDIRETVCRSLHQEIVDDIKDPRTAYYAPRYASWMDFLTDCNGNEDYATVMQKDFSEDILERMWQISRPKGGQNGVEQ